MFITNVERACTNANGTNVDDRFAEHCYFSHCVSLWCHTNVCRFWPFLSLADTQRFVIKSHGFFNAQIKVQMRFFSYLHHKIIPKLTQIRSLKSHFSFTELNYLYAANCQWIGWFFSNLLTIQFFRTLFVENISRACAINCNIHFCKIFENAKQISHLLVSDVRLCFCNSL